MERLRARLRALDLPAVTGTGEVERALAAAVGTGAEGEEAEELS